jgi:hypothetical protein
VSRHRANQTRAKIQEKKIEEMVTIPQISEFVEVRDLKAKAFHYILKTRIHHDEQLSHEILDLIQKQDKIKGNGDSSNIPLYEQCYQANVCVCCDRFICGTDELHWIKKNTLIQQKSRLILPNLKTNCSHVLQFMIQNFKDCYFHQGPDLQGMVNIYVVHNVLNH